MHALIDKRTRCVVQVAEKPFAVAGDFRWVVVPKGRTVREGFRYEKGAFIDPAREDVDAYRGRHLTAENRRRDQARAEGVTFMDARIPTDERSVIALLLLYIAAQDGAMKPPFHWITADNTVIPLTREQLKMLVGKVAAHVSSTALDTRTRKTNLLAARNADEVDAAREVQP